MVSMRTVKEEPVKQKNGNSESTPEFSKKSGIIYCLSCGIECSFEDGKCTCGKNVFMDTNVSGVVGGYIELANKNKMKSYYNKNRHSKSIVKMNEKRMIHQLLTLKDKINIPEKVVDKIYNMNIIKS